MGHVKSVYDRRVWFTSAPKVHASGKKRVRKKRVPQVRSERRKASANKKKSPDGQSLPNQNIIIINIIW